MSIPEITIERKWSDSEARYGWYGYKDGICVASFDESKLDAEEWERKELKHYKEIENKKGGQNGRETEEKETGS